MRSKKILSKPKAKVPSVNPEKFIGNGKKLVRAGHVGFFKKEEVKEQKWLS